jgi:hypothetical protein
LLFARPGVLHVKRLPAPVDVKPLFHSRIMKRIEKTPLGCCGGVLPNSAGVVKNFQNPAILLALLLAVTPGTAHFRTCLRSAPLDINGL